MSSHFPDGSVAAHRVPSMVLGERLVLRDLLAQFEKSLIVAALIAAGGNQRRAATALGVLPTTLQEKLKRFGLLGLQPGRAARGGNRAAYPNSHSTPHVEASITPLENKQ